VNRRQKIIVSVTGIFIVLLILIGLTYGYFLTRITGNSNPNSISVTTANLELVYGDGTTALLTSNTPIEPGKFTSSKDFTVTNNGNALTDYAVTLEDFSITYASDTVIDGETVTAGTVTKMVYPEDMEMTITCTIESDDETRDGTACGNVDGTLPTENSIIYTNSIEVDDIHNYVLTLTYVDSGIDQSADMNKSIQGKIDIIDPKSTIDLEGSVATYQTGDYVEINSTPIKSEIVDGNYKLIGVEPGSHTLYVKYKDANGDIQTRGSQTLTINKGNEASVSGTKITFTDASRTATVDVNSSYEITVDETVKSSLRDAIISNSMSNKNGTTFVSESLSGIATSISGKNYDTTISESTDIISSVSSASEYYWTYADDYIVDEKNGFTLIGVHTCKYSECFANLTGKYLVSNSQYTVGDSINSTMSTTGLTEIYKVTTAGTSATSSVSLTKYSISTLVDIEEKTLLTTQDDLGISFYYRGDVTDNYVNFAGMCWRIVRIEGDGSIKLLLEDQYTTCNDIEDTDGSGTTDYAYTGNWNIGRSVFGYKYDNKTDTYRLNYLNYVGGVADKFEEFQTSKLSDVIDKLKPGNWCYDDLMYEDKAGLVPLLDPSNHYILSKSFYYGSDTRLNNKRKATLKCEGTTMEKYRTNNDMYVGTLTADEVVFAGGKIDSSNSDYYLINDYQKNNVKFFWTISPSSFLGMYSLVSVISYDGRISITNVYDGVKDIRPAVSINSGSVITGGDGTLESPYVIGWLMDTFYLG